MNCITTKFVTDCLNVIYDATRGADLCWALGGIICNFTPILPYFQHWRDVPGPRFCSGEQIKRKIKKGLHQKWNTFSPNSSGHLRSNAHQSRIIRGNADVDHTQIVGGIQSNYWEDISPPGFRHLWMQQLVCIMEAQLQAKKYLYHSVRTRAAEPLHKSSCSNSGFRALKAPAMLFKLVVHRTISNFLQQLLLKISATFVKNKCKLFRILVQQKVALLITHPFGWKIESKRASVHFFNYICNISRVVWIPALRSNKLKIII